ncbi:rRNA maturation RNase YbeY [Gluconacetobacter azotocaptans]|nr:rRNA maturation RNase YbeY [Gluconacetobacter azotocaptans]
MEPRSSQNSARPDGVPEISPMAGPAVGLSSPLPRDEAEVDVIVADPRWHGAVPRVGALVQRAARAAWEASGPAPITIVLGSDRTIRRLNARHRNKNKPTNVLTFEYPAGQPGGDVMIALDTVRREARAAGRPIRHHLMHLVVHGILHLRGHDHHQAGEARQMEMEESRILGRLAVPNPWKNRTGMAGGDQ